MSVTLLAQGRVEWCYHFLRFSPVADRFLSRPPVRARLSL